MFAGIILLATVVAAHLYMRQRSKMIYKMIGEEPKLTIGVMRDMQRRFWKPLSSFIEQEK